MSIDAFSRLTGLTPAQRALLGERLRARTAGPELTKAARAGDAPRLPMSHAQHRLWFAYQSDPAGVRYNVPLTCRLSGGLDRQALASAVKGLVDRHEILRSRFLAEEQDSGAVHFVQQVLPPGEDDVLATVAVTEAEVGDAVNELAVQPFDLEQQPPLRAALLVQGPRSHMLVLVLHHIVFDAWSERVLWDDLSELYAASTQGRVPALPPLDVQFADIAVWEQQQADNAAAQRHLDYWKTRLAGLVDTGLPTDRPRPAVHDSTARRLSVRFGPELTERLHAHCRAEGATVFTTVLTAFMAVLHHWTGQDDVAVGSLVAGRTHPATEQLIGPFVNTVVLRGRLHDDPSFRELLGQYRETVLDALSHQQTPFERVVEALRPLRDPSRHPLFQVLFQVDGATTESMHRLRLGDARVDPVAPEHSAVEVDLVVGVTDDPEGLAVVVEYAAALFDHATVVRFVEHLRTALTVCVEDPDRAVRSMVLSDAADRALLAQWANPHGAVPGACPLPPPAGGPAVLDRAVPGHPIRVLDARGQAVAVGVFGELHVAPAGPTGRRARFRSDGRLEVRGRTQDLVEISGTRVDLGEIEAALHRCPGVTAAAVRLDGPGTLTGYVAGRGLSAPQTRDHLAQLLPAFLLPPTVMVVDAIPRTADGFPDLHALPDPGPAGTATPPPDRELSEVQAVLAALIGQVLDIAEVSPQESFFDLGGDSILALQLVIRARREGWTITPRNIFRHKTAAALARHVTPAAATSSEPASAASGTVPPTPIMHWLRELDAPIDAYHQSLLLTVPAGLRTADLDAALTALISRHDMLRSRLVRSSSREWTLQVPQPGIPPAGKRLRRVDAASLEGAALQALITEQAHAAGARLAPDTGRLVEAVWFDAGPHRPGRLLVAVHHLVVDGVSWRILAEDLEAAHSAITAGRTPQLAHAGTSFRSWALRLQEEARRPARGAELPFWTGMLGAPEPLLTAVPIDPSRDVVRTARSLTLDLPAEETAPLLAEVPAAFHGRVHEVLLAALALAVTDWHRRRTGTAPGGGILVDVEGHGREEIADGIDLSRTVGWFTSVYPVRLDPGVLDRSEVWGSGRAAGRAIKRIKEQLRAVPDGGLGYGMLRHLNPDTAPVLALLPRPQICFNYLGRFAAPSADPGAGTGWGPAPESGAIGGDSDPQMPLAHPLELTAVTRDHSAGPRLTATWSWPAALLPEAAVRDLGQTWFRALRALSEQAAHPGGGGRTPSDLPLVQLNQTQIEQLEAAWRNAQ